MQTLWSCGQHITLYRMLTVSLTALFTTVAQAYAVTALEPSFLRTSTADADAELIDKPFGKNGTTTKAAIIAKSSEQSEVNIS